jgi:hypothetical protein
MKRILLTVAISLLLILPSPAQETERKVRSLEELEEKEVKPVLPDTLKPAEEDVLAAINEDLPNDDTSTVTIGDIMSVEETGNETIVRIGKKGVRIVDNGNDTEIIFGDCPDQRQDENYTPRFKGHLGGIEFGFNGFLSDFWSTSLPAEDNFMSLNTGKSTNFNFIFPNINIGITSHFGLVAAIGFNFSDYHFDLNNNIQKDDDGNIIPFYPPEGIRFEKSKLATTYAILPVIFEGQIPVSHRRTINIGAGFIGAIKLCSHTKVVYYNPDKVKVKSKDDYSLNLLRYGATVRLGYEMIQVYGTTYFSRFFEEGKGPELYPFEVGIALTFNN